MYDFATYFAWFVLVVLFAVGVSIIVALGSLPKKIALKRRHPQVEAINAASWIGLAFAGIGWPIAFVWAFLRSGQLGYGELGSDAPLGVESTQQMHDQIVVLERQIAELQVENQFLKASKK